MSVIKLIDRLARAKQTAPDRWIAGCPCCESRNGRPISVREADGGRVLLHAFCGCSTEDVLSALGLQLGDLFEQPAGQHFRPSASRIPARDLLQVINEEILVASIIVGDFIDKKTINEADWSRLATAAARIGRAKDHGYGR